MPVLPHPRPLGEKLWHQPQTKSQFWLWLRGLSASFDASSQSLLKEKKKISRFFFSIHLAWKACMLHFSHLLTSRRGIRQPFTYSGFSHHPAVVLKATHCVAIAPLACWTWLDLSPTNRCWQTLLSSDSTFVWHFHRNTKTILGISQTHSPKTPLKITWNRSAAVLIPELCSLHLYIYYRLFNHV